MRSTMATLLCILAIAVVITSIGCGGDDSLTVRYFPADIGNWWEYEYRFAIVIYDTLNNDTTEYLYVDSLHEGIVALDTMAGWLCYRFCQTRLPYTRWFAHPDTALLYVAQTVSSDEKTSSQLASGVHFILNGNEFHSCDELASHLRCLSAGVCWNLDVDTLYILPPYKYYVYPLRVGCKWVKMTDPWYEEREAVAEESLTVDAGTFHALKIEATTEPSMDHRVFLWISEQGLIRDSMCAWGIVTDTVGNTVGFFESFTLDELTAYHLE